ncbi:hypothetical protein B7463_g3406, partial [Scytalidium lignicola]
MEAITDPSQEQIQISDLDTNNTLVNGLDNSSVQMNNPFEDIPLVFGNISDSSLPPFYYVSSFHSETQIPSFDQWSDSFLSIYSEENMGGISESVTGPNDGLVGSDLHPLLRTKLPSYQPELNMSNIQPKKVNKFWCVTPQARDHLLESLEGFQSIIPSGFTLPTCHTLSRYMAAYIGGFHDHLPFLHIPTFEVKNALPELSLAIAAVGGKYCFESIKAVELFKVSKKIAFERLRRIQESRSPSICHQLEKNHNSSTMDLHTIKQSAISSNENSKGKNVERSGSLHSSGSKLNSIELAQTFLLLLVVTTWSGSRSMYTEALSIQSILASLIREHKFGSLDVLETNVSWEEWVKFEGAKRTCLMAYCLCNFHSIMYNTAPAILNTELYVDLPCSETEWKSPTATAWEEIHCGSVRGPKFQETFHSLFSDYGTSTSSRSFSSLSGYLLVHALIQQIFLVRQVARCRPGPDEISQQELSVLEQALINWQHEWNKNPESSLDPMNPHGPIPFNSTALLRIAYIRLYTDIGSWTARESQDPQWIARAMLQSPVVERSIKVTQAAAHSAHALSIPVRLGINLVSRHQIFAWSLQHSVCSLECAFLLSKWLDAVTESTDNLPPNTEEQKLLNFVINMLTESESNQPSILESDSDSSSSSSSTRLSARIVKIWAKLFCGERVWDVVNVVGRSMYTYGDMLEANISCLTY